MQDLGSCAKMREGSNPFVGTKFSFDSLTQCCLGIYMFSLFLYLRWQNLVHNSDKIRDSNNTSQCTPLSE